MKYWLSFLIPMLLIHATFANNDEFVISKTIALCENLPLTTRIEKISQHCLGKPYENEPLGEGIGGTYNQEPLFRTDKFDCLTYVSTVTAMALAHTFNDFTTILKKINYQNGDVSFQTRNHIASLDWIPNNVANGIITPLTAQIAGKNCQVASALIDKKSWYEHLSHSRIKLRHQSNTTIQHRLRHLRRLGQDEKPITVTLPYIPLTLLFSNNKPNSEIFAKIPSSAIVFIIRQNWPVKDKIGTELIVSHVGFAIRDKQQLYFRHASSDKGQVLQLPLETYLRQALKSPSVVGISVYQVNSLDQSSSYSSS